MPQSSRRLLGAITPKSGKTPQSVRSRRSRRRHICALFVMPVIFVLLIGALSYTALAPIAEPYINMAMLIVGDSAISEETESVNLMEAPSPPPLTLINELVGESDTNVDAGATYFIRRSDLTLPQQGDQYAQITVSGTTVDSPVFWGDYESELNRGVGTFMGSWLPGFGRTILLAGHRNTDFAGLETIELGAVITVETFYGTYTYEVVRTDVFHMNIAAAAIDFFRDDENIILYTCYPFGWIGAANYRLFVFGDKLSGTPVDIFS